RFAFGVTLLASSPPWKREVPNYRWIWSKSRFGEYNLDSAEEPSGSPLRGLQHSRGLTWPTSDTFGRRGWRSSCWWGRAGWRPPRTFDFWMQSSAARLTWWAR